MNMEGRLTIDLERGPDGAGRATIVSSRPLGVVRALVGRPANDAVKTLPLLFNVCGLAQGAAAAQACERALGVETEPDAGRLRQFLVCMEMLREHLVRVVLDWQRFLGSEPRSESMLRVMRLCTGARRRLDPGAAAFDIGAGVACDRDRTMPVIGEAVELVEELVLGEPIGVWSERGVVGDLERWCETGTTAAQKLVSMVLDRGWASAGGAAVNFLPALSETELAERLFGAESGAFVAAPTWNGVPQETSALSRQAAGPLVGDVVRSHGHGLLARVVARLVEIARLPGMMSDLVDADEDDEVHVVDGIPQGRGLAQVEAARGRLVHGVELNGDVVHRYAILAPTEWNFHAEGGAARGLADIAGLEGDVRALAALFVSSVDPCVGYEVRVH